MALDGPVWHQRRKCCGKRDELGEIIVRKRDGVERAEIPL